MATHIRLAAAYAKITMSVTANYSIWLKESIAKQGTSVLLY
jgi:hypothetical protein